MISNGSVDVGGSHPTVEPWSERPLRKPKRLGALLRRNELMAGNIGKRSGAAGHVAAFAAITSRESVEQR